MPRPRVFIKATFISTKAAKAPSVFIERPGDISELVGVISCKEYDLLKTRITEIVENVDNGFYFHKDENYIYRFDESALPNGGIYGLKERRATVGDISKLTASKLLPIKSAHDFEKNVTSTAMVEYKLGRSSRRIRKVYKYTIELCIVLIKERRSKKTGDRPSSIEYGSLEVDTTAATLLSMSSGGMHRLKRKAPLPFTFQAKSLCILLHAPIETQERKTSVVTGVPGGKLSKELMYDLGKFITVSENVLEGSSNDEEVIADENFVSSFTLSQLRLDLMVLAVEHFAEEYAVGKKSLGTNCKLFIQKQWNSSSWIKIPSTAMLWMTLKDQMSTKGRVKNGVLAMRCSFGRSKAGMEFKSDQELDDYTCEHFGEGIKYSQSGNPVSPYVQKVGKIKRDANWNKPARIVELVSTLYTDPSSKLHYGFLKEHGNSIFRIISANLSVHKENSVFLSTLNDPANHPLSNEIITNHILMVYVRSHHNDLPNGPMPETDKYPPTNATMMITPPTFREWKASQLPQFNIFGADTRTNNITPTGVSYAPPAALSVLCDELVGVTFRAEWDEEEEVSVMVEGNLTINSTMEDIMREGEVNAELGGCADESYKYLIMRKGGGKLTLKWDRFKCITMDKFMCIKNIHDDYIVVMKRIL